MEEQKIIIGREGNQPFPITQDGVSGRHASLTIRTDGTWVLEDLNSTNGTYIRNKDFVFERVGRKVIEKDTIIRLGSDDTIRSLQFMAVRLVAGPKDFSFEFGLLKSKWDGLMERRDKLEKQIALMSYLPVGASVLLLGATISVNDIHVIRGVMFLPSILSPVINTFGKKKLKKRSRAGLMHVAGAQAPVQGHHP